IGDMSLIVDKILTQLNIRLMSQRLSIDVSDKAKAWLGEEAYEPQFGARPLKRFVQRQIETPLARKMIKENLTEGTKVNIDLVDDGLIFEEIKPDTE
ncbi:ATP-dependent chaperone ClpB, partial [Mammaliicoccus fleurettii]